MIFSTLRRLCDVICICRVLTFCQITQYHVRSQNYIKEFEKSKYGAIITWTRHLLLLYLTKSNGIERKCEINFRQNAVTLFRRHVASFSSWICSARLEWNILFYVLSVLWRTSNSKQTKFALVIWPILSGTNAHRLNEKLRKGWAGW